MILPPVQLRTEEVTPALWKSVELLFGANGACGGCWCQAWRLPAGERWNDVKGTTARARLKKSLADGTMHAVLAFDGATPVGWCNFGPRDSYPRLNRARTLACDDSERVTSIPCFFVKRGHRGKGVATALLAHVLRLLAERGAGIAEGYPAKPGKDGRSIDTFSWTGTPSLFEKAGFRLVGDPGAGKLRMRKAVRRSRAKLSR